MKKGILISDHDSKNILVNLIAHLARAVPGVDSAAMIYEGLDHLFSKSRERRLNQYCQALFNSEYSINSASEPLPKECDIQFGDLLEACLQDSETRKTEAYAQLTIAIRYFSLDIRHRRHFITSLKQLSFNDLELLRQGYIAKMYSIIPDKGFEPLRHSSVFGENKLDDLAVISVNLLKQLSFINEESVTKLGCQFIESTHKRLDLEPQSIGWRVWKRKPVVLVESSIKNNAYTTIKEAFKKHRIRCLSISDTKLVDKIDTYGDYSALIFYGRYQGLTSSQSREIVEFIFSNSGVCKVLEKLIFDHRFPSLPGMGTELINCSLEQRVDRTVEWIERKP